MQATPTQAPAGGFSDVFKWTPDPPKPGAVRQAMPKIGAGCKPFAK